MNKKTIGIIISILVICAIGISIFFILNNKNSEEKNDSKDSNINESNANIETSDDQEIKNNNTEFGSKVLVVYFSATNNTKSVAKKIAINLNADLFEIEPVDEYTSNDLSWTDSDSRVSKEHDDKSLRNVKLKNTTIDNWKEYDTILIGYPIWWGVAAWPTNTFVTSNDFTGKTVIPFCTSSSSGIGESGKLLAEEASSGNWKEGYRFSSNPSDADIKKFTDSIK